MSRSLRLTFDHLALDRFRTIAEIVAEAHLSRPSVAGALAVLTATGVAERTLSHPAHFRLLPATETNQPAYDAIETFGPVIQAA